MKAPLDLWRFAKPYPPRPRPGVTSGQSLPRYNHTGIKLPLLELPKTKSK